MRAFDDIRRDFPVLSQVIDGKPITYLDSAASAQVPLPVIKAMTDFATTKYANIHRGLYQLSQDSTDAFDEARAAVAEFIGCADPGEVIFTRGTTESLNLLAYTWGEANIGENDEIIMPVTEHHSDLVPWQQLALRKKAIVKWIEVLPDGTLDLESYQKALSDKTKLVSFAWVSNVFGTINPVKEITALAKEKGAIVVLDGAQGVPHLHADVKDMGIDFLAFSGHKMLGPTGIGVLWGRRELLEAMPPFHYGGDMILSVRRERSSWAPLPNRFEAGTPNIVGAVGLGAAVRYLQDIGMDNLRDHDKELLVYAINKLNEIEGLQILGPQDIEKRSSVLSFYFRGLHPHDIATVLGREGVCVRAGHHCCQPLMREIGLMGTTRASIYIYNNREDIDRLYDALLKVGEIFKDITAKTGCRKQKCNVCCRAVGTIVCETCSQNNSECPKKSGCGDCPECAPPQGECQGECSSCGGCRNEKPDFLGTLAPGALAPGAITTINGVPKVKNVIIDIADNI